MPKRKQCPTCGKFLSNDVAALRDKLESVTTLFEEERKESATLREKNEFLVKENLSLRDRVSTLEEIQANLSCDKHNLESKVSSLLNRRLWQRIRNKEV